MIRAVLFDMDGTLLDTLGDLEHSVNHAMRTMGFPERSRDEVRLAVGNGVINLIRRSLPEGTPEESVRRALAIFRDYYERHDRVYTKPYPGIKELIAALRDDGYELAIVSNKFDGAVKELDRAFFGIGTAVGETPERPRKPAPDMVFAALDELGCRSGEAVYIGDTEVDLATARNSGCTPLLAAWGFRTMEELTALGGGFQIAGSAAEALEIIRRLG